MHQWQGWTHCVLTMGEAHDCDEASKMETSEKMVSGAAPPNVITAVDDVGTLQCAMLNAADMGGGKETHVVQWAHGVCVCVCVCVRRCVCVCVSMSACLPA